MAANDDSEIKKFQTAVLLAATEAVIKEITPERMQAACNQLIEKALADLHSLHLACKNAMEEILKERLKSPEVQIELRAAVERGINEAIPELPAKARGAVIDIAIKGMVSALSAEQQ